MFEFEWFPVVGGRFVSPERAAEIGAEWLGRDVVAEPLYGEWDQNFSLRAANGERFVLKITVDGSEAAELFGWVVPFPNTPTIAEFKRRFGPTLHEYTRMTSSRSRLLEFLLAARNRFR